MKNFYLIYGSKEGIINKYVDNIKNKLKAEEEIRYDLSDTSIDDVIEDAKMVSIFTKIKFIVCDNYNLQMDSESLLKYFENYNRDSFLVFIVHDSKLDTRKKNYKEFKSIGEILCVDDDKNYIHSYLKKYIEDNGYKINSRTLDYFITRIGDNIDNATNEVDKLFLYKVDDKIIDIDSIDEITINNKEEEIFLLSESVIMGDVNRALDLYNKFIANGYEEVAIIALLANQFRFLLQVKILYDKGNDYQSIASSLNVHPYRVKMTIQKIYDYTKEELFNYLNYLYELDRNIKTGNNTNKLGLKLFIINKNIVCNE